MVKYGCLPSHSITRERLTVLYGGSFVYEKEGINPSFVA